MALWGNNDNVTSRGTVSLNYSTKVVTGNSGGSGTQFGNAGSAQVGDIIRFGARDGVYFGDAVIIGITSARQLTIGSTMGLSGASIASTDFTITQAPKSSVLDSKYSEASWGTNDSFVYAVDADGRSRTDNTKFETGVGWVGVTTYTDTHGTLRVKKEILVAMSGISTGNSPEYNNPPA